MGILGALLLQSLGQPRKKAIGATDLATLVAAADPAISPLRDRPRNQDLWTEQKAQLAACRGLLSVDSKQACLVVPVVVEMLEATQTPQEMLAQALAALPEAGGQSPRVLQAVRALTNHPNAEVSAAARIALGRLTASARPAAVKTPVAFEFKPRSAETPDEDEDPY